MNDYTEKYVFENRSNGTDPPEPDLNTTVEEEKSPEEPVEPKKNFKTWLLIPILATLSIIGGAIISHFVMYSPVIPLGKDLYLSEMGLISGLFEGPNLEAVTVADFFALAFSAASVILADLFFHYILINRFLDRPEYFLANPTLRLKTYMIFGCYIGTVAIEAMALYLRMGMNQQILNDPDNPLREFQIHGLAELIGYSLLIIFLNAACAFLATLLIGVIKKEMEK